MVTAVRNYTISDADLTMFVTNLVLIMTRDITEFADFSVDAADVTALGALGNQFEMFPPDTFYQGDVGVATQNKDSKKAELLLATRRITNRALAKWGQNSAQYGKFGVKGISQMSDKEILATARLVILTSENYLTQLATEGLTQTIIDDYTALVGEFEDLLAAFYEAVSIRDMKTNERIELGNQLYALVSRYCTLGKTIWDGVNEAKYNDYIIYTSSSPGTLAAPQNLVFNYSSKVLWWDTVNHATSYQLQWWDGSDYAEIYAGNADNFAFVPPDGLNKFRVRAHNAAGYGPWSDILEQYYYSVLPKAQNLQIIQSGVIPTEGELTWDAVPTAFNYKIYVSVDNLGEPPAHWLVTRTVTEPAKTVTLTSGKRNYFKVETNNTFQTSMSDPIYIET